MRQPVWLELFCLPDVQRSALIDAGLHRRAAQDLLDNECSPRLAAKIGVQIEALDAGSWRRCDFTFMPTSATRHSKAALRAYELAHPPNGLAHQVFTKELRMQKFAKPTEPEVNEGPQTVSLFRLPTATSSRAAF
jgi:hypothetical protein